MAVWSVAAKVYRALIGSDASYGVVTDNLYASRNRTIVCKAGSGENGSTVIHTVTAGKTFYLCSITLSGLNASTTNASLHYVTTNMTGMGDLIYVQTAFAVSGQVGANGENSVSFPMPLKITAGKTVSVGNIAASSYAYATITGWEE